MADEPVRGEIGQRTYEAVKQQIASGLNTTEAFRRVAEDTSRSVGTVQTSYYRIARTVPGGGGVRLRPRSDEPGARAPRTGRSGDQTAQALARQLIQAAEALAEHVTRLEDELTQARRDSQRLADVQRMLRG